MKENEEIISRRKFFRKASNYIIPAFAIVALPSVLTSCEIDEEYPGIIDDSCSSCKGTCSGACTKSCSGECSNTCGVACSSSCGYNSCKGSCRNNCGNNCRSSSK